MLYSCSDDDNDDGDDDESINAIELNTFTGKQAADDDDDDVDYLQNICVENDENDVNLWPEYESNWFQRLVFSWLSPLFALGNKRALEASDMYAMPEQHRCKHSVESLSRAWQKEVRSVGIERASLFRALTAAFWREIVWPFGPRLAKVLCSLVAPSLLHAIVAFVRGDSTDDSMYYGVSLVLVSCAALVGETLSVHVYWHWTVQCAFHVRAGVVGLLFDKALRLSTSAQQQSDVAGRKDKKEDKEDESPSSKASAAGDCVNMMANDAKRLREVVFFIHFLWVCPLLIVCALALMYVQVGASAFAGFAYIVVMVPAVMGLSKLMERVREQIIDVTDERVQRCSRELQSIKEVKLLGLEQRLVDDTMEIRRREVTLTRRYQVYLRSMVTAINRSIVPMSTAFVLVAYSLSGHKIDSATAFTVLALMNVMRFPFTLFNKFLSAVIEARVALARLSSFMRLAEVEPLPSSAADDASCVAVSLRNCSFAWHPIGARPNDGDMYDDDDDDDRSALLMDDRSAGDAATVEQLTLHNLNVEIARGSLTMIVGKVGSGKTSFLSALLGEMYRLDDGGGAHVCSEGKTFVGDQSWLINGTLRDNILFGRRYDEARYADALERCSLLDDLKQLPAGDQTELGERGVNVSGGQQARVCLARALYRSDIAELYLLDDPLSAVDMHVGRHIFERCVLDGLVRRGKTVLLVTHHLQYLRAADQVLHMEQGRIEFAGTFDQLESSALDDRSDAELSACTMQLLDEMRRCRTANVVADDERAAAGDDDQENGDDDLDDDERKSKGKLIVEEDRERGQVELRVLKRYFVSGSMWLWAASLVLVSLSFATRLLQDGYVSVWSMHGGGSSGLPLYAMFAAATGCVIFLTEASMSMAGWLAAKRLFASMMRRLVRFPLSFFASEPLGRVLNRLSSDIDNLDSNLVWSVSLLLARVSSVLTTIGVLLAATLWSLLVVPLVAVFYAVVQRYYRNTSRELRRLDSTSKSPVFMTFAECMNGGGLASIRCFGVQRFFVDKLHALVDVNNMCFFLNVSANRWLGVRLGTLSAFVVLAIGLIAVLGRGAHAMNADLLALALSYALTISTQMNGLVKMLADAENQMNSAERVLNYIDRPIEQQRSIDAASSSMSSTYDDDWPSRGRIEFRDVVLRYRADLEPALDSISFVIDEAQHVGVRGRTGAGKSSLVQALFRLVELDSGAILIDGVDIATVPLDVLRARIACIPQRPVIFAGTLRDNIDPLGSGATSSAAAAAAAMSDEQLYELVDMVHLGELVRALPGGLDFDCADGGANFSSGEKQLVCLLRALAKGARVIVLDECTSSVDSATDRIICDVVASRFAGHTVLAIAHRLATLDAYDRILTLDRGRIRSFE
jgi:ATP-binding cassette, subfamily C (CFTR/MRP), member 1